MDLDDLEHNTRDGLHIASLAGSWIALVAGLGGLREHGTPSRSPLPPALTRLAFTLAFRGRRLHVALTPTAVSYRLRSGAPLEILHDGQPVTVTADTPLRRALNRRTELEPPTQPPGREPARRRPADTTPGPDMRQAAS